MSKRKSTKTSSSSKKKSMPLQKFDYKVNFYDVDFRKHPELYKIGRGEQGVLLVEPYKTEICPHWKFKTPEIAQKSAEKIYQMFLDYKAVNDFVGADMARKFLQMGYTRSRRYANHKSGRKYKKGTNDNQNELFQNALKKNPKPMINNDTREILPDDTDDIKAQSARVFFGKWKEAREDEGYLDMKKDHLDKYLNTETPEWAKMKENMSKEELAKKKKQFADRRKKVAEDYVKEEQENSKEEEEEEEEEQMEDKEEELSNDRSDSEKEEKLKSKGGSKKKTVKSNNVGSRKRKSRKASSEEDSSGEEEEKESDKETKSRKKRRVTRKKNTRKEQSSGSSESEDDSEEIRTEEEKDPDYTN